MFEIVYDKLKIATVTSGDTPYGLIENGAVAIRDTTIVWVGASKDLPQEYQDFDSIGFEGRLMTPAMIDCHTHIIHGGNRAAEFEMYLNGLSYEDVSKAGGGINSTVKATRGLSQDDLVNTALPRIDSLIAEGVSTIEIKSGYGLDQATELNMLRAARQIGCLRPVDIRTSFLGAHALPIEYIGRADAYIDQVCIPTLKAAHAEGLVDAVDGFCETIGFTRDQIQRVFDVAKSLGLPVKLHAEQLSNMDGAALAASYNALSADHLEFISESGIAAMAKNNVTAVVLPGAFYALRETKKPPIALFREAGVPMAVATDCNPGTSPLTSLLLAMNMACTLFRLTPEEALIGTTRAAAGALGLSDRGTIKAGSRADLAIWDVDSPAELSYRMGFNPLYAHIFGGRQCRT